VRKTIAATLAAAAILAAGCGSASSSRHTRPGWSTLTSAQEGYVCNEIKALRIPGQTPTFPLAQSGNGYYQFPRDTGIQTRWNAFTLANGVEMISKAVKDLCPYYKKVLITFKG
jgi:hypothetical protein